MSGDDAYLRHIRDAIRAIDEYTREGRDQFFSDKRTQDAVIRNFEVIEPPALRFRVEELLTR